MTNTPPTPEAPSTGSDMSVTHPRTVRSFVRREGRMTKAQQRAFETLWPTYGIDTTDKILEADTLFGRTAPLTLEIGFGNGTSLVEMAQAAPERNFIGIEVHRPGVGNLLQAVSRNQIKNLRIICADAVDVLENCFTPGAIDQVQIFFPDPWHKKRHHKRRLIQPAFVKQIGTRLKTGGLLHIATDWPDYACHIIEVMQNTPEFTDTSPAGGCQPRPEYRPMTKFELRGKRLGHPVCDLIYQRR